jgi:hypothetical protein
MKTRLTQNPAYYISHILFLSLFIWAGCTSNTETKEQEAEAADPSAGNEITQVQFKEVKTFTPENLNIPSFASFDFDERGRMYIVSGHDIYVLNKEGELLKKLGGSGRGPGEFDAMGRLVPKLGTNKLYVYADMLQGINTYDLNSFEFDNLILLEPQQWSSIDGLEGTRFTRFYVVEDDVLLARFSNPITTQADENRSHYFILMDGAGNILSGELMKYPATYVHDGQGLPAPIFVRGDNFPNGSTRSTVMHMSDKGNFYAVWNEELRIIKHTLPENTTDTLFYPITRASLDESEIIETYRRSPGLYRAARQANYPETWPAVDQILTDSHENIWVSTITEDSTHYQWLVFDEETKNPIGEFVWPGRRIERAVSEKSIQHIKDGYLYAFDQDSSSGGKVIKKYEITLNN